jgi:hypothetical protein
MMIPGRESRDTDTEPRDAASTFVDRTFRKEVPNRSATTEPIEQCRRPARDDPSPMPEPTPVLGHELAGSEEPVFNASPTLPRLFRVWGDKVAMGIMIAATVIGLARLASHATQPDRDLEPDDCSGAGMIVRYEVLHLWLPESLTELAKRQYQSPGVRVHEELQRFLELQDQEDLWYALTTRGHQVNGDFADLTFIRRPYYDPHHFPELLDVLATAAGNPPRYPNEDFSTASVHIMPGESLKRGPQEVIAELLRVPKKTRRQP